MKAPTFCEFLWLWNRSQGLETPSLHLQMALWLEMNWQKGRREILLLAFRNSGKSTLVGVFCGWLLLTDPNLRILVLAADLALARKMVRNVKRLIESHPLTGHLKPRRPDQWASEQFTIQRPLELRDPSMLAKGISANVTGSRADVVICDDVEVPNTCDTAQKRADLRERLSEIDYVLVPGGLQVYMGTPHTYDSIYRSAPVLAFDKAAQPYLAGFARLELPIVDKRGDSRWPERFPEEKIEDIKRRSGPNKFASQMMLKPVNITDCRLDPDDLQSYAGELEYREANTHMRLTLEGRRLVSASCWWDPAYGTPGKGDSSVIAAVYTDAEGGYWLHRVQYLTHDPARVESEDAATGQCRQVARFVRDLYLPCVQIETNGIGKFLPGLLRRELSRENLACAVVEESSHRAKDTRILEGFDAVLAAKALHAHTQVWQTPFIAEMRDWQPGLSCRDDGLDAVSGCLLSQPVRLARSPVKAARPDWGGGNTPHAAQTEFTV